MSTNSTIAIELSDGTVRQISCHYDGYPEHNGKLLHDHWNKVEKILQLMSLGDLSSLGKEVGSQQYFNHPNSNWCLAYGRDRGEPDTDFRKFESFDQYSVYGDLRQYNYIFRNGVWYVAEEDLKFRPLAAVLINLAVEALK